MRFRLALAAGAAAAGLAAAQPPAPHPWAVAPHHGGWFVCVKSYTGPDARRQAEELAGHVRSAHNAAAFLHEWGAEERDRQEKQRAGILARRAADAAPFLQTQALLQAEAAKNGTEFRAAPLTVRVPKVTVETQWAVLVGGWPDMDAADAAKRQVVAKWPAPAERLLDRVVSSRPGGGTEGVYVNPFATGMIVPNPTIKRAGDQAVPVDPIVLRLNADEPLSLLKCGKAWTLIVKDFPTQTVVQTQGQDGTAIGRVLNGGDPTDPGRMLERTATTAREFAATLRRPEMQQAAQQAAARLGLPPVTLDAFVLHVQTGSRVTVGAFDSLDDPALQATQRMLAGMTFQVAYDDKAQGKVQKEMRLFDGITPMPVPGAVVKP